MKRPTLKEAVWALGQIYNVLGPSGPCKRIKCPGCSCEMSEAVEIARMALGIRKGAYPAPSTTVLTRKRRRIHA